MMMIAEHKFSDVERRNTNISKILSLANNGAKLARYSEGSFENEALENEDRSTKHPNLEKEAPKTRKRRPLNCVQLCLYQLEGVSVKRGVGAIFLKNAVLGLGLGFCPRPRGLLTPVY